ncbi:MAG: GNAT family N-acetyltransferase [Ignavibacteriales bacterium]|nr:GNAT family N-acetyltransferase [Ignavibacteriales bacterium]
MDITIRQATVADAAVVARFNELIALETESKTLDAELLQQGVEALLADPSKGIYFLAESGGTVVGQTMITYEWSDWRNGTFWWIQSVYVANEARGAGVFKSLFDHIHALAAGRPDICGIRLYVEENNARARQIYERLGMKHSHYRMYEMDFVL